MSIYNIDIFDTYKNCIFLFNKLEFIAKHDVRCYIKVIEALHYFNDYDSQDHMYFYIRCINILKLISNSNIFCTPVIDELIKKLKLLCVNWDRLNF